MSEKPSQPEESCYHLSAFVGKDSYLVFLVWVCLGLTCSWKTMAWCFQWGSRMSRRLVGQCTVQDQGRASWQDVQDGIQRVIFFSCFFPIHEAYASLGGTTSRVQRSCSEDVYIKLLFRKL